MAYAALLSLENTIKYLLSSSIFPGYEDEDEDEDGNVRDEVGNVRIKVLFLKELLRYNRYSSTRKKEDVLSRQLLDAIYKLEDVVESFTSNESSYGVASCEDVEQEIRCFLETVRKIEMEIPESNTIVENQSIKTSNEQKMMVGFEDDVLVLVDRLLGSTSMLDFLSIVGMQGIGKTTLVNRLYNHSHIRDHFDAFAFVTIGQRCSARKIMLDILVQIGRYQVDERIATNEQLYIFIYQMLKDKRYLLVFDDVWDLETWRELKRMFPYNNNGSRIIITTTLFELAVKVGSYYGLHHMRFMSVNESWTLLRMVTFAEGESCPLELESLGMKIAQNSQGLPKEIVWVGNLLSKREKTIEFWKEVAENYNSYITVSDDEMSIINDLYASYEYLPQQLKACFLYMGVFPQNYVIPASKLIGLWVSEGFLEKQHPFESLEQEGKAFLLELVDRSVAIVHEQSSTGEIKTCRVHHLFWHLCVTEAKRINFFHVINGHDNIIPKDTYIQRRLCIRENIVLAIKDVHELMDSASKARSLLCLASHHQYPLPVCFEFKLLRVLDVLSIRLYNFPLGILKLIQLRYLALTFNGELPASISVLGRLQILIVRLHIRIRSCTRNPSFLPMDIWKLKELRHLYIIGSDLPNPCGEDQLSSLQILSGVSPQSCTLDVLERIQQLKKLGIRIELTPSDDAAEPISPFDNLFLLRQLESFKCVVVNPNFGAQIIKFPDSNSVFSDNITKISLSGCGLPWYDMEKIYGLPRLKVLKLRDHAFTGAVWNTSDAKFPRLRSLLLESMDLVSWITTDETFPCLESLILKHCYQLEEIPSEITRDPHLRLIELVDCSRCASYSAKKIAYERMSLGDELFQVRVTSST